MSRLRVGANHGFLCVLVWQLVPGAGCGRANVSAAHPRNKRTVHRARFMLKVRLAKASNYLSLSGEVKKHPARATTYKDHLQPGCIHITGQATPLPTQN